jgi:hypothetical protein
MHTHRRILTALAVAVTMTTAIGCTPMDPPPTTIDTAECDILRRTIRTALEAFRASEVPSRYPASLEELLGVWLDPETSLDGWTYVSDGATYTLAGPC